jgi:hypothetical protein
LGQTVCLQTRSGALAPEPVSNLKFEVSQAAQALRTIAPTQQWLIATIKPVAATATCLEIARLFHAAKIESLVETGRLMLRLELKLKRLMEA